jgi:hypothetical protein
MLSATRQKKPFVGPPAQVHTILVILAGLKGEFQLIALGHIRDLISSGPGIT